MSAKLKEYGYINLYDNIFEFLSGNNDERETKNYLISISGYGDLVCFGYENKLLIASLNYSIHSKNSEKLSFLVNFQGAICDEYLDDSISSILIIPIASQKQSSQGFPDWSCICIGLTNGLLKFYDQSGHLIFHQKLSESRIEQIQLHSTPCYNALDVLSENLMVLCNNCCFQIDGFHLYDSLNMFKRQLARFQAGFVDHDLETFQLHYKKWLIDSQETVVDIVFGYETSDCVLDNIFANASNKGPFAIVPDQVSKHINCVTVGKNPFIVFYRLPLESDALDMGDLAQAVYSKVKGVISTSFSSWLGSSRSANKIETVKKPEITNSEIPSRLHIRHSIEESCRKSTMIIGCPQYYTYSRLAAMTDDFGRIFLIDIDDGVIIRIWKGYRDAQISITTSSVDRHVNFLIIYAPRRSMIEIWTIPFGERVASFDMQDRNGRLLHVPHGLLGISRCGKSGQKLGHCYSTYFLDSNGKLFVLEIPFHLSLVNSSNERSQDHLVLKHFKNFIRDQITDPDQNAIRMEFLLSLHLLKLTGSIDLLVNTIIFLPTLPIEFIVLIFNELIDLMSKGQDNLAPSSSESERGRLKDNFTETLSLINCYKALNEMPMDQVLTNGELNLDSLLNLDIEDCARIKKLFDLYCEYHKLVRCHPSEQQNFHLFINSFTPVTNTPNNSFLNFQLAKQVSEKDILNIGYIMFNKCITGEYSINTVINLIIRDTNIDQAACFKVCFIYLIHESVSVLVNNLSRVKQLLLSLLSGFERQKSLQDCFSLAYEICEKSTDLMTSLLIAMTIRVIICEFLQYLSDNDSHEFATYLTTSLLSWNGVCQRLEDLSIFSCLLKCRPVTNKKKAQGKISFDRALTLAHAIENGRGIFSESFAKWAFKWNLKFEDINKLYKSLGSDCQQIDDERSNLNAEVEEIFAILYKQLPHSLEYDSVLINVSWEYTRLWSKTVQRVDYLERACELLENVGPAGGLVIQGIGGMMWDMHIKSSLESFVSSNKTESPKYSSLVNVSVVTSAIRFLKIVLSSLENLDVMPTFSSEPAWNADKSRSSLIELAVAKDPVTENAVELHIQLLYALQLVAIVDLRSFNCQLLYSNETRQYFFAPLTNVVPPNGIQVDLVQCKSQRMRFIDNVISSCTGIFSEGSGDNSLCQTVHGIIKILSGKWQLDLEDIRQSWIVNYYKCGLDSQAAMYLDKVENTSLLAASLLRIVGLRIKKDYLMPKSKNYREYFKYVTPQLNKWFQSLVDVPIKDTSLQQSSILMDQVLEWLPENSFDFEAATCLQSLMLNIEKTKKYVE